MGAGKLDLYIEQGATFERKLLFKDGSENPIDLTGFSFAGKVKKNISDTSSIVDFTFVILDQGTNTGEVMMSLTPTQCSDIPLKAQKGSQRITEDFAYDVERTAPSGKIDRILEGVARVSPEVTK